MTEKNKRLFSKTNNKKGGKIIRKEKVKDKQLLVKLSKIYIFLISVANENYRVNYIESTNNGVLLHYLPWEKYNI